MRNTTRLVRTGHTGAVSPGGRPLPHPDGWIVEVVQLVAGDRLRIRHHGFYVADVANADDLARWIPAAELAQLERDTLVLASHLMPQIMLQGRGALWGDSAQNHKMSLLSQRWKAAPSEDHVMRRSLGFLAACGLAIALLASCVTFGPGAQQPSLAVTDLSGTWVSGDGASLTFTSGGVVSATKFDFYKVIPKAISACGVLSGTGSWQLHNPADDYPPSPAGSPTNLVDLTFTSLSPPGSCSPEFIEMTSWNTGSKPGLCVQIDPDTPCNGYVFTKR